MKLNSINNINFEKTLRANCKVLDSNGKPCKCAIYELDAYDDRNYFKKTLEDKNWEGAEYLEYINQDLMHFQCEPAVHTYVMENKSGDCLGFTTSSKGRIAIYIDLLETAPKYKNDTAGKKSPYKYIGETLVAFLTKKAANEGKRLVGVNASYSAIDFYSDKCGFNRYSDNDADLVLTKPNFKPLTEQNERHTKGKINIVS